MKISRRLGIRRACACCGKMFQPFHREQRCHNHSCMMKLRWRERRESMLVYVKQATQKSAANRVKEREVAAVKDLLEGRITPLQFYNRAWHRGYMAGWERRDGWYQSKIHTTRTIPDETHISPSDPVYRLKLKAHPERSGSG